MAKKIVWNKRAHSDFINIIEYLQSEWNDSVIENFVTHLDSLLDLIADNPEMGKVENPEKQIRGFVITKHTTLFYRVDGKKIMLLRFFDNKQHPKKKTFSYRT